MKSIKEFNFDLEALEATKPGSLETFNHPPIPTPSAKVALNSMGKYLFSNFI
jgi:hypothetical protein